MRYVYPCNILPDEEDKELTGRDSYNVSFPDVPPALTCGDSWTEAVEMAIDALEVALSFYIDARKDIPKPSPVSDGQVMIPVPPLAGRQSCPCIRPCASKESQRRTSLPEWRLVRKKSAGWLA